MRFLQPEVAESRRGLDEMLASTDKPSAALTILPSEVLWLIFEVLVLITRDVDLRTAVRLQLVSRSTRQMILPLIYRVIVINVPESHQAAVGWDGRRYNSYSLAFLSWCLCHPTAAPRQFIHHLVFCCAVDFEAHEINASAARYPELLSDTVDVWTIPFITVNHEVDLTTLRRAGVRATNAHCISTISHIIHPRTNPLPVCEFFEAFDGFERRPGGKSRIWTLPRNQAIKEDLELFDNNFPGTTAELPMAKVLIAVHYRELASNDNLPARVQDEQSANSIYVEVDDDDALAPSIWRDVHATLTSAAPGQRRVVMVFNQASSLAGATLVTGVSNALLHEDVKFVRDNVRIAFTRWKDISLQPMLSFARILDIEDPWPAGVCLAD
ncbi:hypothetical protein BKA62DRAFT_775528 [Auriculariales sp. MPI-PUGE-AT-0066]|nr:hypothetical protein BKA62DRAFT_775528 [Auriculariales sp. MPI-PUGE-AT-0066]